MWSCLPHEPAKLPAAPADTSTPRPIRQKGHRTPRARPPSLSTTPGGRFRRKRHPGHLRLCKRPANSARGLPTRQEAHESTETMTARNDRYQGHQLCQRSIASMGFALSGCQGSVSRRVKPHVAGIRALLDRDKRGWKLCHIEDVGLSTKTPIVDSETRGTRNGLHVLASRFGASAGASRRS
jgi:hypothetical protein